MDKNDARDLHFRRAYFIIQMWSALLLVTQAIDKIMTGEGIKKQDLVISKLLRQNISTYKSLFPHVSAVIQLINDTDNGPLNGDTIKYIYTNSKHNNPVYRFDL